MLPASIYLLMTCIYPLGSALLLGFYDTIGGKTVFVGLGNYIKAINDSALPGVLVNSLAFTAFSVLFHMLIGLGLALLLNVRGRRRNLWRALQLIPWLLPASVVSCIWLLIYQPQYGLLNTVLSKLRLPFLVRDWLGDPGTALASVTISNIWMGYPFFAVMILAALQNIPSDLYEAARIDGAGGWGVFWYITLPLLRPVILTTSLLDIIWTFRFFDLVWIMTKGGPIRATEIMPTYVYKTAFYNFNFHYAAALGGIMVLIMICLSIGYLRIYLSE